MSERTKTRHTTTTPGTGYGRVPTESMRAIVESSGRRRSFWQQLALIGPAFVAGAWQFGPGNLTTEELRDIARTKAADTTNLQ